MVQSYIQSNWLSTHAEILTIWLLMMNDTSEVVYINILRQKELHSSLITAVAGEPITLDVTLNHWGRLEAPLGAYYGQVSGRQIVDWWAVRAPVVYKESSGRPRRYRS